MNNTAPTGALPPVLNESPLPEQLGLTAVVESLLKRPRGLLAVACEPGRRQSLWWLLVAFLLCAAAYGVVMGAFAGGEQLWVAPAKLLLGLLASALLCLPSLYIAASLSGRDVSLAEVGGTLLAAVTLSSVLLLGFAPAAWLFSVSTSSVGFIGALHLLIWLVSTVAGLRLVWLALGDQRAIFGGHLLVWTLMFLLVCLQMSTTLRPLIGTSAKFLPAEKQFFLAHWWECLR